MIRYCGSERWLACCLRQTPTGGWQATHPTKCTAGESGTADPPSAAPTGGCAGRKKGLRLFEPAGRVCEAPRPGRPEGGDPEGARKRAVLLCLAFLHEQESRSPAGARPGQRLPLEAAKESNYRHPSPQAPQRGKRKSNHRLPPRRAKNKPVIPHRMKQTLSHVPPPDHQMHMPRRHIELMKKQPFG